MDKRIITGLVLICAILFGFSWYNSKQQSIILQEQARIDSLNRAAHLESLEEMARSDMQQKEVPAEADSLGRDHFQQQLASSLGETLYASLEGTEESYVLENNLLKLTLSNKGGRVSSVELKDYKRYNGESLFLFTEAESDFNLSFFTSQQVDTRDFYFAPVSASPSVDGDSESFAFRLYADSLSFIEYLYTVRKDDYMVDFDVRFSGMDQWFARNQTDIRLQWETVGFQNEKGFDNENNYSTVAYHFPGDDSFEDLSISTGSKQETISSRIEWVAFKQQFFSSIIICKDGGFQNGEIGYETFLPNSGKIKRFNTQLSLPYTPQTDQYHLNFYFGPNKYKTLKAYGMEMRKLVPLGGWIINWINRWIVIPTFDFLGKYINNFGLIILLLTIIIKIIIATLTYKSYLSMAKIRVLKPEMDALAAKYPKPEDAMKKQQATMELYRNAGVSPMGGCLPLLIQLPILIAMFRFFPASIELRQESFLWADDLSSYDSILNLPFSIPFYGSHVSLFTLLMALSIVISTKINSSSSGQQQMPGMKVMMYMMPVLMLLWFNNYSSGLSYYYLLSNIITIGQTYGFRKVVNEDRLHQKLKETASKPKKKSKFMQRYEEAMKQQQATARQKKR